MKMAATATPTPAAGLAYSEQGNDISVNLPLSSNNSLSTTSVAPLTDENAPAPPEKTPEKKPEESLATVLPKNAQLQAHLQSLTTLKAHVANLRKLPMHLLTLVPQSAIMPLGQGLGLDDGMLESSGVGSSTTGTDDFASILGGGSLSSGSQAQNVFRTLKDTQQTLLSQAMQSALTVARDSEKRDISDISTYTRRERKKRRNSNSDSPATFPSFQLQTTNVFPRLQKTGRKIESMKDLTDFVREHRMNVKALEPGSRGSITQLSIWALSRPKPHGTVQFPGPLTIRVTIRDVVIVFLKMSWKIGGDNNHLAVESLVALGPREKKSPHSHSDYTVFQKLTQQVTRMLEQEPGASLPQIIELFTSYEELFITRCSGCERVLSQEGHIPPVARVWIENLTASGEDTDRGRWDTRHVSCLQA